MGSTELSLLQKNAALTKLSPKTFLGANLLFVPAHELASECMELLGDNPFFYFNPPCGQSRACDIEEVDADHIPSVTGIEDHLIPQISTCPGLAEPGAERIPASFWCSLLDTRGYLNTSQADIAEMTGMKEEKIASFIRSLQYYVEPAGLFASDLTECLMIQLERKGYKESPSSILLTEGNKYLASGRVQKFAEIKGWDRRTLDEAMSLLKHLDPSPGKNFAAAVPVFPEIEFITKGRSTPMPRLLRENLPSIGNNLSDLPLPIAEMLVQKWFSPVWSRTRMVITRLGMRYRTLIMVSACIAKRQERYLLGDSEHPSPMTYETLALELALNTSTVFRVVKDTWCLASGKVFRMDIFFSRGLNSRPDISVHELRALIGKLNSEGLNDREISEKYSIPIRTVAYHRNKQGLPSVRRGTA